MNSAQKIGKQLKEWRLAKGVTLETIAIETKIGINILKKMEEGLFQELPSYTYTRGFIKNYLRTLRRELTPEFAEEIRQSFEELKLLTGTSFQILETGDSHLKDLENFSIHTIKKVFNLKFLMIIIFVGIFSAGFYFFKHINLHNFTNYSTYFDLGQDANPNDQKPSPKKIDDIISQGPQVYSNTNSHSNESPSPSTNQNQNKIPSEAKTTFALKPLATPSSQSPEPTTLPKDVVSEDFPYVPFKKINDLGITDSDSDESVNDERIFPKNFKDLKPVTPEEQIVFVHAYTGDSWISYRADNSIVKSYTLKLGEKITIRGKNIFFSSGNINALKIFHNSKLVKCNQVNSVKSFVFPSNIEKEHSVPLFVANKKGEVFFYKDYQSKMMPKPSPTPAILPSEIPLKE
ncbi:MAG: helix-turn-helix domain-containing protein [Bacteriovoracaceae bacterium]|nr:helix-turn-helix domain-containing protein [Bacteriovoracaceae bacterium]